MVWRQVQVYGDENDEHSSEDVWWQIISHFKGKGDLCTKMNCLKGLKQPAP